MPVVVFDFSKAVTRLGPMIAPLCPQFRLRILEVNDDDPVRVPVERVPPNALPIIDRNVVVADPVYTVSRHGAFVAHLSDGPEVHVALPPTQK